MKLKILPPLPCKVRYFKLVLAAIGLFSSYQISFKIMHLNSQTKQQPTIPADAKLCDTECQIYNDLLHLFKRHKPIIENVADQPIEVRHSKRKANLKRFCSSPAYYNATKVVSLSGKRSEITEYKPLKVFQCSIPNTGTLLLFEKYNIFFYKSLHENPHVGQVAKCTNSLKKQK